MKNKTNKQVKKKKQKTEGQEEPYQNRIILYGCKL